MSVLVGNVTSIRTRTNDPALSVADALTSDDLPAVVRLVLDTMTSAEMARVTTHAKELGIEVQLTNLIKLAPRRKHDAGLPKPDLSEQLVPTRDERGGTSLAWYTRLLYHALGPTKPERCLVLWGPPGVGKTLAIERIGQLLAQQREEKGVSGNVIGGDRTVRAFAHFSCADIEDKESVKDFIRQVTEFAHSAPPDAVLVIDDFDALIESRRASDKLLAILASSKRCRRVVVMNDYYERAFYKMRTHPLRDNFQDLQVGRAHIDKLARYLQSKVPLLKQADEIALDIATRSGGDVRAALTSARIDAALIPALLRTKGDGGEMRGVGINADTQSVLDPISVSVSRCAREERPALAARARFFDADEMAAACEMLHVNTPRYLSGKSDLDEDAAMLLRLQATADVFESLSRGDCYEQETWRSGFAGVDGENNDKEFLFNMSVGTPIAQLGAGLQNFNRNLALSPKMDFPMTKVRGVQKSNGTTLCAHANRTELMSRFGFKTTVALTSEAARTTIDDSDTDDDDEPQEEPVARTARGTACVGAFSMAACDVNDMRPALFGKVCKERLLAALKAATTRGKRDAEAEMAWQDLCRVTARCAAQGYYAEDFARECLLHLGTGDEKHEFTEAKLRDIFERTEPSVAKTEAVRAPALRPTKRRKQAAATKNVPEQQTLTAMMKRLNENG